MSDNKLIEQFTSARKDRDLVVIEGFHALKHAWRFEAEIIEVVTDNLDELRQLAEDLAPDLVEQFSNIKPIDQAVFAKLAPRPPRTGVIAIAKKPKQVMPKQGRTVLLDKPKDLGNIGTIIRTCAAADIAAVLVTGEVDPWHPTVVTSAAGLNFALIAMNFDEKDLPDLPAVAFDERGEDLGQFKPQENQLLIFGSERDGISPELKSKADQIVKIPMRDKVSSLNLASAVAIVVYRN